MLDPRTVENVRRMLNQNHLTQHEIALLLGISRGSVGTIARGRWKEPVARFEDEFPLEPRPAVRCPGCGGTVYPPCRLCRVREWERKRIEKGSRTRRR